MLVCQLMVWVLAAVKRFDTVALYPRQWTREALRSALWFGADREADCG